MMNGALQNKPVENFNLVNIPDRQDRGTATVTVTGTAAATAAWSTVV